MSKQLGASRERAAVLLKAAFTILKDAGGTLPVREVFQKIPHLVQLTEYDTHVYEKTGYMRWYSTLHFHSVGAVKSGLIKKSKGRWSLTPEGLAAADLPADKLLTLKDEGYRRWAAGRSNAHSSVPDEPSADEDDAEPSRDLVLEDAESLSRQGIVAHVDALSPYQFQDLVAALLRGMGYHTPLIAAPGRDGGTDILAYRDPLGTVKPHIRIQVKHRETKATRDEVAALRGIIRSDREIGLFVSSGGFTSEAVREAGHGNVHIELMDLDRLLELWIGHYDKLSEEEKTHLRLVPVHFLAPDE